jgi:hypothetical protein
MAINYLKIRSALKDLRPEWLLELRPRRNRITRQSCLFSVPNGDLEFEFHPSPPTPLIRSFRGQSWSQFLSPQAIAFELQSRLIGGLNRCKRSSLRPFQQTPKSGLSKLVGGRIATRSHRPNLRSMAPSTGVQEPFSQIAVYPLLDGCGLDHRVRNSFARHLPDQGRQINQNHMRRLLQAFISPIERQKRMSQNEENNVNQCIAVRRESDCDRRR